MQLIYNISIFVVGFGLKITALFNEKIKKGVVGRSQTFSVLQKNIKPSDKTLWFHCASLGEYEQGLPVFQVLRHHYKNHKIVLSFFSPSGYDIRKNTPIADVVVYLPLDTKANANCFFDILNPELIVFVKYDIWPHFLNELKRKQLRAILISASFRAHQPYFKCYGKALKKALFAFEHIFTQNDTSKNLLESINYHAVTVSGDTRFDRVSNQLHTDNTLEFIEIFKQNNLCVVAGSTWPEDDHLIINFINSEASKGVKFIIAPHNIKATQIKNIQEKLSVESVLFSEIDSKKLETSQVFIVDTIGILSKIYSYADIAYVGGALGNTGLHNTLEPAVFGIPIIIGNYHEKFPEAQEMIDGKGLFSISNQHEFDNVLSELLNNPEKRLQAGKNNAQYISKNRGAVEKIRRYLKLE